MRTKLAALLLAVLLLTGCVPYVRWQITTNIPQTQQMPAPTPAPTAMPQPDSGLSRRQMVYGSAGLLTEPTVLVSVYLNDAAGRSCLDRGCQGRDTPIPGHRRAMAERTGRNLRPDVAIVL